MDVVCSDSSEESFNQTMQRTASVSSTLEVFAIQALAARRLGAGSRSPLSRCSAPHPYTLRLCHGLAFCSILVSREITTSLP